MDFPLFVYVFSSGVARLLDTRDQQSKRPPLTYYELKDHNYLLFFYHGSTAPSGPGTPHYRGFTITLRHTTFDRTPLDEWSARRRDLYLTTHSTHNRQTSMPPGGIRTHNLSRRAAADLRLWPRGYWDWHYYLLKNKIPILSPICRLLDSVARGSPHHSPHPGYTPGVNTFTAIVDLSRFNNSCLKSRQRRP